jgi:hypothetical protein
LLGKPYSGGFTYTCSAAGYQNNFVLHWLLCYVLGKCIPKM